MPAKTNERISPGPAYLAAATPVNTKIPVPTIAPMPSSVILHGPNVRLSPCSGSSLCLRMRPIGLTCQSWLLCLFDVVAMCVSFPCLWYQNRSDILCSRWRAKNLRGTPHHLHGRYDGVVSSLLYLLTHELYE